MAVKKVSPVFDFMRALGRLLEHKDEQLWSSKHRYLLLVLGCFFAVALLSRVHGFSFPDWHRMIDGSRPTEVLLGQVRGIRSDDSFVVLPLAISQAETDVRFSCRNPLVGLDADMHLFTRALCLDGAGWISASLRPITWGYLAGADFGMAWLWWFVCLGLFYTTFLLLYRASHLRFWFSLLIAVGFVYAPYQQFWSLNMGEIFLYGFASIILFDAYWNATASSRRWIFAVLWAYSVGALILTLYPPTQVMVGYLMLPCHLLILIRAWKGRTSRVFSPLPLILSTGLLAVCLGILFYASRESLFAMANSSYPGKRVSLGGGLPWQTLFQGLLLPSRSVGNWDRLGNVCEAATFLLFGPLLLTVVLVRGDIHRMLTRLPLLSAALGLYLLLIVWTQWIFPEALARISLLSFVPPGRAVAGLGVLDLAIWVSMLIMLVEDPVGKTWIGRDIFGLVLWFSCLLATAWHLHTIASVPWVRMIPYLVLGAAAYGLAVRYPLGLSPLFAIWSLSLTMHFNPLVQGGYQFLADHPLSKLIQEVAKSKQDSRWVVDNQDLVLGNLPRMLGVASIGGTHVYPQMKIWKEFDPAGQSTDVYNRYAHIVFDFQKGSPPVFQLRAQDSFVLTVDPEHPAFERLGVGFFMVRGRSSAFDSGQFELLRSHEGWQIYKKRVE